MHKEIDFEDEIGHSILTEGGYRQIQRQPGIPPQS